MPESKANAGVKSATIGIVVTRADGTVEDLGVVSYYHQNPLRRLAWQLRRRLRKDV